MSQVSYIFFGTGPLAESVLMSLYKAGFIPSVVVTKPNALAGRHMQLQSPHIKTWCDLKNIPVLQPEKLDENFIKELSTIHYQLCIVASYGKIIPKKVLDSAEHGTLNVHPSLLPLYRGASPIETALLDGQSETGVTIMKLDEEVDHGPILVQTGFVIPQTTNAGILEVHLGQLGGELLVQVLPHYLDGSLIPKEQDHTKATLCKKISKEMGEVTLTTSAQEARNKFRAFNPWPGIYFFLKHNNKEMRVKVTTIDMISIIDEKDSLEDIISDVIPEGKKEMDWESFKRGYLNQ